MENKQRTYEKGLVYDRTKPFPLHINKDFSEPIIDGPHCDSPGNPESVLLPWMQTVCPLVPDKFDGMLVHQVL